MPWPSPCCAACANEIVALAFAVLFSLLLAAVIAAIILRRRGLYFSLLTLAFSQIAFEIAFKWTDVTGGENGLQGVPRPMLRRSPGRSTSSPSSPWPSRLGLLWRIAHSPFGRSLQALRDNEQRAQSLGYDTFRLKFASFVLMGGFIGYSGGLLALMLQGAYADNLSWQHAGDSLLMAVLGGVHHFLGPAVGRHRLHPAGGPAVGADRELVADVRADRDPVRARLARGHPGPGLPPARPAPTGR